MSNTLWQSKYSSNSKETEKERSNQSKTKNPVKQTPWLTPLCLATNLVIESSRLQRTWISSTWTHILLPVPHIAAHTTHGPAGQLHSLHATFLCMCPKILASPSSFGLYCNSAYTFTPAFSSFSEGAIGGLWHCRTFSGLCNSLESWDETPWHPHSCLEELSPSRGEVRISTGLQTLGVLPICSLTLFPTVNFSLL